IIQVAKHRELHTLLELAIRSGYLVPFCGTTPHPEVTKIAIITAGSNLEIQYSFRVARSITCNVGHITVIIDNLDFFNDLCGEILDSRFDVTAEIVLTVDPRSRYRFALSGYISIFINFYAIQLLERVF